MAGLYSKGRAHELDLCRRLYQLGYAVIRAPASGSRATRAKYPDVIAIKNGRVLVIEVKSVSYPRTIYISKYQYEKMIDFASRSGGEAYIAVKIIGTGEWLLHEISELEEAGGKYRLKKEKLGLGKPLLSVVAQFALNTPLERIYNSRSKP